MNALRALALTATLAVGKLALYVAGVRRCLALIDRLTEAPIPTIGRAHADALARQVAIAGALYPGRALCLEQSMLLYALLRRARLPARIRFGVRPRPFEAHAWVECNGQPVLEDPEILERFLPLEEPRR